MRHRLVVGARAACTCHPAYEFRERADDTAPAARHDRRPPTGRAVTPPSASAAALHGSSRNAAIRPAGLTAVESLRPERFAVSESKLRVPSLRPGLVSRTGLVNRLRAARSVRLATLVAPAGYGKTTLLAQWAARDERPFVWLSLDARDNDPFLLLRHLAAAFDRIEPIDPDVLDALAGADSSVWVDAVPRLATAVSSRRAPFVAVLDDADTIRRGDSADLLAALAEHVPAGSMLVVAGRSAPALPIARLRAAGGLLELGTEDLALSRRDSLLLVRAAGLELDDERASDLATRSEGWAAGLYLATRAHDDARPSAIERSCRRRRPLPHGLLLVRAPGAPERGATGVPAPQFGARAAVRPAVRRGPPTRGLGGRARVDRAGGPPALPARPPGRLVSLSPALPRRAAARAGAPRGHARPEPPCPGGRLAGGARRPGGGAAARPGLRRRRSRRANPQHDRAPGRECGSRDDGALARRARRTTRGWRRSLASRPSPPGSTPFAAGPRTPSGGSRARRAPPPTARFRTDPRRHAPGSRS